MKLIDWGLRALLLAAFLGLLFAPNKWGFPLALVCFAFIGVRSMLYPQGVLGWVKGIDADDRSIWWVPRLIGGSFVAFVLLAIVAFFTVWR